MKNKYMRVNINTKVSIKGYVPKIYNCQNENSGGRYNT